jgi:hypothetical protein
MTDLSVVVLAFHGSAEVLKRTLPTSKASLPNAKFFVATSTEDKEVLGLSASLGIPSIQFTRETMKKDGAVFNYAGIARACMTFARNDAKKEHWVLITRAQVMLDGRLSELDLSALAKDSLYGCGMKELITKEDLSSYKPSEPSALEVRDLVPTSSFLLSYSAPPQFDAWSADTQSAVQRFSACFIAKYMIHLKLAYLGIKKEDDDEKKSQGTWGFKKSDKLRIEPVHAFAAKNEEVASEKPPTPEAKAPKTIKNKLFGVLSAEDDAEEFRSRVRTELDAQQNVASPSQAASEDVLAVPKTSTKNVWKNKLLDD